LTLNTTGLLIKGTASEKLSPQMLTKRRFSGHIKVMLTFTPTQTLYLFCCYFFCAIPFGLVISLVFAKKDVREQGSGNPGAANVSRLMGLRWGMATFLLDALKAFIAVRFAFNYGSLFFINVTAVVAVVAHCYPIYLGFKGSKGVGPTFGGLLVISPPVALIAALVFLVSVGLSRRVSVGSIIAAISLPILVHNTHWNVLPFTGYFLGALIILKHRENIMRLYYHQEPKFF
jgi:acyl phosphate:glycerol-3-phosphate acyltransferase